MAKKVLRSAEKFSEPFPPLSVTPSTPLPKNTHCGAPEKKFMCLISWERTQKGDLSGLPRSRRRRGKTHSNR